MDPNNKIWASLNHKVEMQDRLYMTLSVLINIRREMLGKRCIVPNEIALVEQLIQKACNRMLKGD